MDASAITQVLKDALPDVAVAELPAIDMPTVGLRREDLLSVCGTLRDHPSLHFALLLEVTAADYFPASPRFEIVYHLACLGTAYPPGSTAPARRLRLKVRVSGDDARVPSVVALFPVANWPEREVYDLFGVSFEGHPDLRRILTADDWEGHPLRKDYPVQIRKDAKSWSPVQLSVEEFAANIRAERERASRQSHTSGPSVPPHGE